MKMDGAGFELERSAAPSRSRVSPLDARLFVLNVFLKSSGSSGKIATKTHKTFIKPEKMKMKFRATTTTSTSSPAEERERSNSCSSRRLHSRATLDSTVSKAGGGCKGKRGVAIKAERVGLGGWDGCKVLLESIVGTNAPCPRPPVC